MADPVRQSDPKRHQRRRHFKDFLPFRSKKAQPQQSDESPTSAPLPVAVQPLDASTVKDGAIVEPEDPWEAAYNQLSQSQKDILSDPSISTKPDGNSTPEIIRSVITTTENQYKEYQNRHSTLEPDKINLRDVSEKILNAALTCQNIITAAVALDPTGHASSAWSVVSMGLNMIKNHGDSRDALIQSSEYLANALARGAYIEQDIFLHPDVASPDLKSCLVSFYKAILLYTVEVKNAQKSSKGRKVMNCINAMTKDALTDLQSSIDLAEGYLKDRYTMHQHLQRSSEAKELLSKIDKVSEDVQDLMMDSALLKLPIAEGAYFDDYEGRDVLALANDGRCLSGTRTELLNKVTTWATSADSQGIFWLTGMAGTGKSTVSRTLAALFKDQGTLGATFFFKRTEASRSNAKLVLPTLANQLAKNIPEVLPEVVKAARENIARKKLDLQFEQLIKEPLLIWSRKSEPTQPLVIIIDALDECESPGEIETLLRLFSQMTLPTPTWIRLFLTSRPLQPYESELSVRPFDITKLEVNHDLRLFLTSEFKRMQERNDTGCGQDWPGKETIERLVTISSPLFIFAATICRFIENGPWTPPRRLKSFLESPAITSSSRMSTVYLPILDRPLSLLMPSERDEFLKEFKGILGVVILLATPLSIRAISELNGAGIAASDIKSLLESVRSVINIPDDLDTPVKIFHLSFRDFLTNFDSPFRVDEKEVHENLTFQCLRTMNCLKRNICNLPGYGTERSDIPIDTIQRNLQPALQYACRQWTYHLGHLSQSSSTAQLRQPVLEFLQNHVLHWMEAMSYMGEIDETVDALDKVQSVFEADSTIISLSMDAQRFILKNMQIADVCPMQIYSSGLLFAPRASLTRENGETQIIPCISLASHIEEQWSAHVQTLEHRSLRAEMLAFSPNSQLLASGSWDGTVKLWDTAKGIQQREFHSDLGYVSAVRFSEDNSLVAMGSERGISIWDTSTGELTRQWSVPSDFRIWKMEFSADIRLAACDFYGDVFYLCNTTTGAWLQNPDAHRNSIKALAFSPDSNWMVSGLGTGMLCVWETATLSRFRTFEDHGYDIYSVSFSPDGQLLVSASLYSIRIWNIASGTQQHKLNCDGGASVVLFSPDGKLVASGSDMALRLWDPYTGFQQKTLEGHQDSITTLAFSSDSRLLISGCSDHTVHFWNTYTGIQQKKLKGHSDEIKSLLVSPDGCLVASASSDNTAQLYRTAWITNEQTVNAHKDPVEVLLFSPDGQSVASGSMNGTVWLWDVASGLQKKALEGGNAKIITMAFSSDGEMLATGSDDGVVRIWNTSTGMMKFKLKVDRYSIPKVQFFPGSLLIGCGSVHGWLAVFDINTGTQQQKLQNPTFGVLRELVFSPDGLLMAVIQDKVQISLWDVATYTLRWETTADHWMQTAVFSPTGRWLACSNPDLRVVQLWDTVTFMEKKLELSPFNVQAKRRFEEVRKYMLTGSGDRDRDFGLVFSPDESSVGTGSTDGALQIWCTATGMLKHYTDAREWAFDLSFSERDPWLSTGRGISRIHCSQDYSLTMNTCSSIGFTMHTSTGHDKIKPVEWIVSRGEKVLWLPHEYHRPTASAVLGNTIFLGYASGVVMSLRLSAD